MSCFREILWRRSSITSLGSNSIRLKFVSNDEDYGTGFSITYKALTPDVLPGKFKPSNVPACTLGWGHGKRMSRENKTEETPVVFLCGWCFHGGPWGKQLRLKHVLENCVWFFCAQQFTSHKDGPKGHLLSLKRTPNIPVLAAFPAGAFLSIFVCLHFQLLAVSLFLKKECWRVCTTQSTAAATWQTVSALSVLQRTT